MINSLFPKIPPVHGNTPKFKGVFPPPNGWKERTYYIVDIAFNKNNPVHRAIFFTGFLNGRNKGPGGYNAIYNPTYECPMSIGDVYFMQSIVEAFSEEQLEGKDAEASQQKS